jgi:uncharacterized protein YjbJ (UPF0337 family)
MSTSDSTVKGKWDEVAGKVKQGVGEAVGNDNLANKGAAQQVKGHAEQTWGAVKETVHDANTTDPDTGERRPPRTESSAHDVRESITSTAANVKERIKEGLDDMKTRKSA